MSSTFCRTAAWHLVEEKENMKESLDVKQEEVQSMIRLRRRSTGSSTLSGVA